MKRLAGTFACCAAFLLCCGCADNHCTREGEKARVTKAVEEIDVKNEMMESDSLTREEKKTLLAIARNTVESYVREKKVPELDDDAITERLREKRGAFVTITNRSTSSPVSPEPLRGCIGNFVSSAPLCETVREMAVSACSRDSRFPPVSEDELGYIEIEISALSPLTPADDPLSIKKGVHGIYIRPAHGPGGGTYLPQVWSEHFPEKDAADFWSHLCLYKAGLPRDAWRHPERYDILTYTADVFSENEFKRDKD